MRRHLRFSPLPERRSPIIRRHSLHASSPPPPICQPDAIRRLMQRLTPPDFSPLAFLIFAAAAAALLAAVSPELMPLSPAPFRATFAMPPPLPLADIFVFSPFHIIFMLAFLSAAFDYAFHHPSLAAASFLFSPYMPCHLLIFSLR